MLFFLLKRRRSCVQPVKKCRSRGTVVDTTNPPSPPRPSYNGTKQGRRFVCAAQSSASAPTIGPRNAALYVPLLFSITVSICLSVFSLPLAWWACLSIPSVSSSPKHISYRLPYSRISFNPCNALYSHCFDRDGSQALVARFFHSHTRTCDPGWVV